MSDWISSPIGVAILGAVVGAVFGVAAYGLRSRQERRAAQRHSAAIRKILSNEIDGNLALFHQWWSKVTNPSDLGGGPGDEPTRYCVRVRDLTMPNWSHRIWESQIAETPGNIETEAIDKIREFHQHLDELNAYHLRFVKMNSTFRTTEFQNASPRLWAEIEAIAAAIIEKGNPL